MVCTELAINAFFLTLSLTLAAQELWSGMIEHCAEDPWVYRADWAWSTIQQRKKNDGKRQTSFSMGGKGKSPLGRIGYMGPENPDLSARGE